MKPRNQFWDSSALVPLVFAESGSRVAEKIWQEAEQVWAWDWLSVEVDAALIRRKATPAQWSVWRDLEEQIQWTHLRPDELAALRSMNRGIGLRSADAGHVYVFEEFHARIPDLHMVTFDREMAAAVKALGLTLHPDCDGKG